MRAPFAAATTLVASMIWAVALMIEPAPLDMVAASLVSVGLMMNSTVSTVGMIVTGGRWAHRLGYGVLAVTVVVAVIRPIDAAWVVGVVATAGSFLALASPVLNRTIRKLPSASGPPPRVVAVPLLALSAPCLLGLAGTDATSWALLVVGLSGPVAAFMYSRVIPGGLLAVRVLWPVLALALTPFLGVLAGAVSASIAIAVAAMAWHPLVKASYHPPLEKGSTLPIPPELTPIEVLEAADIDEKGRPR